MMRRVGPIVILVIIGAIILGLRLWKIQVVEHALWARQAAGLLHSGAVLPPDRGRILDATGAVVARDLETYRLVLTYRDFRRGHPLGQVTHARSSLLGQAIPLTEGADYLLEWAWELVHLTPDSLRAYARGEAFETAGLSAVAVDNPRAVHRPRRASDVRYYLREILGLTPRRWSRIGHEPETKDGSMTYLELAGLVQADPISAAALWRQVERKLVTADQHLVQLAERMESPAQGEALGLDGLLRVLEKARVSVEDNAAAKLFREVFGFDVGRVAPETLFRFFDLEWIGRLLSWQPARLIEWAESRRRSWLHSWLDGYALPSVCADLVLKPDLDPTADDFLDRIAVLFAPEGAVEAALESQSERFPAWREMRSAAIFSELDSLFDARFPRGQKAFGREAIPVLNASLRKLDPPRNKRWLLVDRARNQPPDPAHLGSDLRTALAGRGSEEKVWEVARSTVADWEEGFQSELASTLAELVELANPDYELDDNGRLLLARGRRDNVRERFDYLLKDFGTRSKPLQRGDIEYEVVHLVTRFQRSYPGIRAEETRVRHYSLLPGFEVPPFGELVGNLSAVGLSEMQIQRRDARRLRKLFQSPDRDVQEDEDFRGLLESVWQYDDVRGVAGVEGFFDPELRGTNGFRESWGLKQALAAERGRRNLTEPVDGLDVHLTLDHNVQRAAQRTLAFPEGVPNDSGYELFREWREHPVGAIVMVTIDGDVIAAVSEPNAASVIDHETAPAQRRIPFERTLRIPTFQPPGSVFKPFVAAWALGSGKATINSSVVCEHQPALGWAGFGDVRCHSQWGHGQVRLKGAIEASCNSYFSWLGGALDGNDFGSLIYAFGFYEPTGVRTPPVQQDELGTHRTGLREDALPRLNGDALLQKLWADSKNRQRAGNGLSMIEVTPMQLARAVAGLATGHLPDLRLVSGIGDGLLRRRAGRPVGIAEKHLDQVREGMYGVTHSTRGTGYKVLKRSQVGFDMCAKTGSADLVQSSGAGSRVRKHTWVTGWLPADDPQVAFVVFLNDVPVTSSHSAVFVTRQFFRQPETVEWLRTHGVRVDDLGAAHNGGNR